jgi:hypothetical protein
MAVLSSNPRSLLNVRDHVSQSHKSRGKNKTKYRNNRCLVTELITTQTSIIGYCPLQSRSVTDPVLECPVTVKVCHRSCPWMPCHGQDMSQILSLNALPRSRCGTDHVAECPATVKMSQILPLNALPRPRCHRSCPWMPWEGQDVTDPVRECPTTVKICHRSCHWMSWDGQCVTDPVRECPATVNVSQIPSVNALLEPPQKSRRPLKWA